MPQLQKTIPARDFSPISLTRLNSLFRIRDKSKKRKTNMQKNIEKNTYLFSWMLVKTDILLIESEKTDKMP